MNILYIAHRIPYPPNKGDKIRSFHQIRYLSARHRILVCALVDDPNDFRHERKLSRYCAQLHLVPVRRFWKKIFSLRGLISGRSMSALYFYEPALQEHVDRILEKESIDAVFCFSGTSAEYLFQSNVPGVVPGQCPEEKVKTDRRPRVIMDFCDVDSVKWQEYADRCNFPLSWIYRQEARLLGALERHVCASFDHLVVISESEKNILCAHNPQANHAHVIPNGVDLDFFHATIRSGQPDELTLLFTGAMDYYANVEGVLWFAGQVWPHLRNRYRNLRFIVAGRHPDARIRALADKDAGIMVTGEVEDIRIWYAKADCCVVPLRVARGVQNKLLEAMAMARPVVSTSAALRGIEARPGRDLLVADAAEDFVQAVDSVLRSPDLRQQLARSGRQAMERHYDWSANLDRLASLLER